MSRRRARRMRARERVQDLVQEAGRAGDVSPVKSQVHRSINYLT